MTKNETTIGEIETIINKLGDNPLFYLFVSSKELFHSNFWKWLSTINSHATVKLFLDNYFETEKLDFQREYNQSNGKDKSKVDLFISGSKDFNIVIENKVKDFPKIEQLDRIRKSFSKVKSRFVLTTLFHCDEITFHGWEIVSYKSIVEKINPSDFTKDSYHQNLISDYKKLINQLVSLTELLGINQSYDFAIAHNKDLFKSLNQIKLWEGYQKLRASHLVTKFREATKYKLRTEYGVNNQKSTIDFILDLKDDYKIGVQLEDNQFRRFIIGKKQIEFAERLRANNIFFDSQWTSPQKKKMLSYKPDFQYQYEKIDVLEFNQLFRKINMEIENIINIKEEIESKIPTSNE